MRSVAFSAANVLASAADDRSVRLWDAATGALLEGHADKVLALAFDAAGRVLASGAWDGEVRLWGVDVAALNIVSSLPELGNQSQIKNIVVIILTKSVIVKS